MGGKDLREMPVRTVLHFVHVNDSPVSYKPSGRFVALGEYILRRIKQQNGTFYAAQRRRRVVRKRGSIPPGESEVVGRHMHRSKIDEIQWRTGTWAALRFEILLPSPSEMTAVRLQRQRGRILRLQAPSFV